MSASHETPVTTEQLMAFADGELQGEEELRVRRAIDASPELAAQVEMFLATRLRTKLAFQDALTEPVPDRLFSAISAIAPAAATGGADILPFERPQPRLAESHGRAEPQRWSAMAIAASALMVVAGGVFGYLAGQASPSVTAMSGLLVHEKDVGLALNAAQDGARKSIAGGLVLDVVATYRMADKTLCRSLDVAHPATGTAAQAVACRKDAGWQIAGALPAEAQTGQFRPAAAGASIDALLEAGGAGEALPKADVEGMIRNGWR